MTESAQNHVKEIQDQSDKHVPGCLVKHAPKAKKNTCDYRWQAYEKAKSDNKVYDWPAYKELTERGEEVKTAAKENYESSSGTKYPVYPKWYSLTLACPKEGEWDVGHGKNFQERIAVPYWHNSHHVIPTSILSNKIVEVADKMKEPEIVYVIINGLLTEQYNINDPVNMIIVPFDDEVARAIKLPRHLSTATHMDHPMYTCNVKAQLDKVFSAYEAEIIDNGCDAKLPHSDIKDQLEALSKRLYKNIKEWGKSRAKKDVTLDTMPEKLFSKK